MHCSCPIAPPPPSAPAGGHHLFHLDILWTLWTRRPLGGETSQRSSQSIGNDIGRSQVLHEEHYREQTARLWQKPISSKKSFLLIIQSDRIFAIFTASSSFQGSYVYRGLASSTWRDRCRDCSWLCACTAAEEPSRRRHTASAARRSAAAAAASALLCADAAAAQRSSSSRCLSFAPPSATLSV